MCGRYLLDLPGSQLADALGADDRTNGFEPVWNAAPTQDLPVLVRRRSTGELVLGTLRWGLVPWWSLRSGRPTRPFINARAETLTEKPAFREAFARRRCIVPVSGFYEWQQVPGAKGKVPHCIRAADAPVMALAGIYERAVDANGEAIDTYAVITTTPNELMRPLHDRMPAILDEEGQRRWLETPPEGAADLLELLRPYRSDQLRAWEVSRDVNDVRNDHPRLADPVAA